MDQGGLGDEKKIEQGVCEKCGNEFSPSRRGLKQRYCGGKCRWAAWDEKHPRKRDKEGDLIVA